MKLTVFGATGGTGKLIVERALGAGHDVLAYARSPEKLVARHDRLQVVKGELSDAAAIESAVQDADAVICVLTPRVWRESKDLPLASGTQNILAAMQKNNVRRLIFGWGPNIVRPHGRWNVFFTTMFALFSFLPPTRTFMEESMKVGQAIRNSDRDWTTVCVVTPNDKAGSGQVKLRTVKGEGTTGGAGISRADVAEFMLKQVEDRTYVRQELLIGS